MGPILPLVQRPPVLQSQRQQYLHVRRLIQKNSNGKNEEAAMWSSREPYLPCLAVVLLAVWPAWAAYLRPRLSRGDMSGNISGGTLCGDRRANVCRLDVWVEMAPRRIAIRREANGQGLASTCHRGCPQRR